MSGFVWGVATAAYQIEGGAGEDGRGPSVWDTFSRRPGATRGGDTGDVACDSYHRLDQDLGLLARLGVGGYRFSVSWSRVQPDGTGAANAAGLDYYDRLVDGLVGRGIAPFVTLYHWDLPQSLQDRGGWAERDTAARFADYAALVAARLGDRVGHFITLNEPQVVVNLGYRTGEHAPGVADPEQARAATHHLMLGHGLAVQAVRKAAPQAAAVGITLNLTSFRAATPDAAEAIAVADAEHNQMFLSPLLIGGYPAAARPEHTPDASMTRDGDLELIAEPIDFLGINYYNPVTLSARPDGDLRAGETPLADGLAMLIAPGTPVTAMGWPVQPDGLYEVLTRVHRDAPGLALYVTENGAAYPDYVNPHGMVEDPERIDYLREHLRAVGAAIRDGADVRGYFTWTLMDNFEWAEGYSKRFGLVFVDFGTGTRTPKRSFDWYAGVCAGGPPTPTIG